MGIHGYIHVYTQEILELKMKGIDIRGRHVTAWGPRFMPENAYPKEVTMHLRSLPNFVTEDSVFTDLKLPIIKKLSRIMKAKLRTDHAGFLSKRKAYSKLLVRKQDELATRFA